MDTTKLHQKMKALRALPPPEVRTALREYAGLTQDDLATALGVHRETVSRWERGVRFPRDRHLTEYTALLDEISDSGKVIRPA